MKRIILFFALLLPLLAWGQDATEPVQQGINWVDAIIELWIPITTIIAWFLYRLIPTKRADIIMTVINWLVTLIPDNKKGGGKH